MVESVIPFTLTGDWQAAPSAGSQYGSSAGSLVPGQSYDTNANNTGQINNIPGNYNYIPSVMTSGAVLGSSTTTPAQPAQPSGGGGNVNTGGMTQDQKNAAFRAAGLGDIAPVGWNGVGGGGGEDLSSQISDAYAPAIAALQGYIDAAQTGADADIANVGTRVTNQKGQLDTQQGELLGTTAQEQTKFNDSLTSALQDAIRAYNALAQQGNARFGRGSSAGGAVGELANQEFFRQQGGVQKQQTAGDLQFEGERTKIKNFVLKGKQDLDMYHNEAVTEIQKGLRQTLADINARKGDIEINKTKDRIAALQSAKDTAQRVSEANVSYRQGLITTALSNMQEVAGRAFTPKEIAANLAELQNLIFGNSSGFTTSATPQTATRTKAFGTSDDPYADTQV